MPRPPLSRYRASISGTPTSAQPPKSRPFRFLDLPKEIRFMIYEELCRISTNYYSITLQNTDHYLTLVNRSIDGVRILATCRQINAEASHFFGPNLAKILERPPKMIVQADHLASLMTFRDGFYWKNNLLDEILICARCKSTPRFIHECREGKRSTINMAKKLDIDQVGKRRLDDGEMRGIASFILRTKKAYEASTAVKEDEELPPIEIVIETPYKYDPSMIDITTSRAMLLYLKILRYPFATRRVSVPGTLDLLVSQFSYWASKKSSLWKSLPFSIMLKYVGELPDDAEPDITEEDFEEAVATGVDAYRKRRATYGGVVKDDEEEV